MVSWDGAISLLSLEAALYDAITYSLGCRKGQDRNCHDNLALEHSLEIWGGKVPHALSPLLGVGNDRLNLQVGRVRCLIPSEERA